MLDTRGSGPAPAALPPAGGIERVETGVAAGTEAVLVNITMVDATAAGYVTADRCSTLLAGPQPFSNGNHLAGAAVSNLGVVPVDADGSFCIYHQRPVHLTVDVQGSFAPSATGELHMMAPQRVLDTRPPPAGLHVVRIGGAHRRLHLGRADVAEDPAATLRTGSTRSTGGSA